MNFDASMDVLLTFKNSKVIIIAKNVPILNKTQAEQNYVAFSAVFGIDVNDVK